MQSRAISTDAPPRNSASISASSLMSQVCASVFKALSPATDIEARSSNEGRPRSALSRTLASTCSGLGVPSSTTLRWAMIRAGRPTTMASAGTSDAIVEGRPARIIAQRNVVEDGTPSPEQVLAKVRDRALRGLPSLLDRASMSVAGLKALNTDAQTWDISDETLIDAELRGGASVEIARDCILIGRSQRHGGISQLGGIEIGTGAILAEGVVIEAAGGVSIGDFTELGANVTIVASTHDHS